MPTSYHVMNRQPTLAKAEASCRRLAAKYGRNAFAVVLDEMGMPGFTHPYAVVTVASVVA
jgi:hypothetical protein